MAKCLNGFEKLSWEDWNAGKKATCGDSRPEDMLYPSGCSGISGGPWDCMEARWLERREAIEERKIWWADHQKESAKQERGK